MNRAYLISLAAENGDNTINRTLHADDVTITLFGRHIFKDVVEKKPCAFDANNCTRLPDVPLETAVAMEAIPDNLTFENFERVIAAPTTKYQRSPYLHEGDTWPSNATGILIRAHRPKHPVRFILVNVSTRRAVYRSRIIGTDCLPPTHSLVGGPGPFDEPEGGRHHA